MKQTLYNKIIQITKEKNGVLIQRLLIELYKVLIFVILANPKQL